MDMCIQNPSLKKLTRHEHWNVVLPTSNSTETLGFINNKNLYERGTSIFFKPNKTMSWFSQKERIISFLNYIQFAKFQQGHKSSIHRQTLIPVLEK